MSLKPHSIRFVQHLVLLFACLCTSVSAAQEYMNDANTRTPPRDGSLPSLNHGFPRTLAHEFDDRPSAAEYSKYHFIDAKGVNFPKVESIQSGLSPQTMMLRHISGRAYQSYAYKDCFVSGGVAFESTTPASQGGPSSKGCGMFAGHWLYKAGATLKNPVSANEQTLKVDNPARFASGKYVVIYDQPAGSFRNAEHARVTAVNRNAGTIKVTRGYKSTAKAHGTGSIVAEHVLGQGSDARLWAYNLTSQSPRDANGKTFAQFYADWLGENLLRHGSGATTTASVAGVMFDADFYFDLVGKKTDANNDLVIDDGVSPSGENWQGKGLDDFYARVRARLPGKYIMTGVHDARGFKSAHGTQIESWLDYGNGDFTPNPKYRKWNEMFHSYLFAISEHESGPALVHNLTKTPTREYPGGSGGAAKSNAPARLAIAMTLMDDGYFGTHSSLVKDAWWDEFAVNTERGSPDFGKAVPKSDVAAVRKHRGWLGQPLGRYSRLYNSDNFQPGASVLSNGTFEGTISGWQGSNVALSQSGNAQDGSGALQASAMMSYKRDLGGASIKSAPLNVSARQPYTIAFSLRSEAYREVRVSFGNDRARLPVSPRWRRYVITLTPTSGSQSRLTFGVGKEAAALWIDSVYVFKGDAHVFQREFRNGLALANATATPKTIDVGSGYRRISGTQDRAVNSGEVAQQVTLPPYDGLLLIKTNASPPDDAGPGDDDDGNDDDGDDNDDGANGGGGSGDPGQGPDDGFDDDPGANPGNGSGGNDDPAFGGSGTSLGDLVWRDDNLDGIRDSSEPGLAGVTVNLQRCDGGNAATTMTDDAGRYVFSDLEPGSYRVEFVVPAGMRFSPLRYASPTAAGTAADRPRAVTQCMQLGVNDSRGGIDAALAVDLP